MSDGRSSNRRPRDARGTLLAGAIGVLVPGVAHADDVEHCIQAAERGQTLRDERELTRARDAFVDCARETCPALIRSDCAAWLADVEARVPSVVPQARDSRGRDLASVRLTVDGKPGAARLDGKALALDPGERVFRFETDGAPAIEKRIVVREGEKNRSIEVVFESLGRETETPAKTPPAVTGRAAEQQSGGIPPGAWVLGAVGALGVGGFAWFGLAAKNERDRLRESCAPSCDEGDVDAARRDALVANLSLGLGVAALGTAAWIALGAAGAHGDGAARAGVAARPGGGELAIGGRF